mmetsp:Transcript_41023/g.74324  ORF Transcript_41023/g.74324 Transcript_41023/m.74324 type:complete len:204 (+) Transcript_41023:121-732(+)
MNLFQGLCAGDLIAGVNSSRRFLLPEEGHRPLLFFFAPFSGSECRDSSIACVATLSLKGLLAPRKSGAACVATLSPSFGAVALGTERSFMLGAKHHCGHTADQRSQGRERLGGGHRHEGAGFVGCGFRVGGCSCRRPLERAATLRHFGGLIVAPVVAVEATAASRAQARPVEDDAALSDLHLARLKTFLNLIRSHQACTLVMP